MLGPKNRDRGMTLLELGISIGLLGFVMTAIFGFYLLGLKLWSGNDSRARILSSLQLGNRTLRRAVSQSNVAGMSSDPDLSALSLVSTRDKDGNTELTDQGIRRWLSWEVFYLDKDVLKMERIPWTSPAPLREVPSTLEAATGSGFHEVASGGQVVCRHLKSIKYTLNTEGNLLSVDWELSLQSRQKPDGERLVSTSVFRFRN